MDEVIAPADVAPDPPSAALDDLDAAFDGLGIEPDAPEPDDAAAESDEAAAAEETAAAEPDAATASEQTAEQPATERERALLAELAERDRQQAVFERRSEAERIAAEDAQWQSAWDEAMRRFDAREAAILAEADRHYDDAAGRAYERAHLRHLSRQRSGWVDEYHRRASLRQNAFAQRMGAVNYGHYLRDTEGFSKADADHIADFATRFPDPDLVEREVDRLIAARTAATDALATERAKRVQAERQLAAYQLGGATPNPAQGGQARRRAKTLNEYFDQMGVNL